MILRSSQVQQFQIWMSLHSNKYYHLIKALRVQKQQSEISKLLKENSVRKKHKHDSHEQFTSERIANIIDLDNSTEMDDKDVKFVIQLNDKDQNSTEYSRIWQQFQKINHTSKLHSDALPVNRRNAQNKDQKLIDYLLQNAKKEKEGRESQLLQLGSQIRQQQEEVTVLKEEAIELGLQIEGFDKELVDLKANFDREEKKINERSSKYKQEKSKDIMIKNIDRDDMEMRKAMASRIKLNQELDFGFQLQRRRAFNQAKAAINQRKKAVQDKLNKLKTVIGQHQSIQSRLIAEKAELQLKNEQLGQQQIYFCKQVIKNFNGHTRGIQWLVRLLLEWGVSVQQEDFPETVPKDDAAFVASLLKEAKPDRSSSMQNTLATPKHNTKKKLNQHFQTEPNLIDNHEKRNKSSLDRRKLQRKITTVYFDIQSEGRMEVKQQPRPKVTSFNINTKSLKKIYEHAGNVIGHMIKNHSMNYNSCRVIAPTAVTQQSQTSPIERSAIEDKIKAKFTSIRQKERRNNLKRLLFGNTSST